MDLVKIGRYIACKRKEQGLTQSQVAEKLGMSDKSVSKWERGICLPDVSIYSELCGILGISLNEFLAGEDIEETAIIKKSEENILSISTDGKWKQKRLKRIIRLLAVALLAVVIAISAMIIYANRPQNYIMAVEENSAESKIVEMLVGPGNNFFYNYVGTDRFNEITIYVSEYRGGKFIGKNEASFYFEDKPSSGKGTILINPDFEKAYLQLIVVDGEQSFSMGSPITVTKDETQEISRLTESISDKRDIKYDEEQSLGVMICNRGTAKCVELSELEKGNAESVSDYDYVYYFSVKFSKGK